MPRPKELLLMHEKGALARNPRKLLPHYHRLLRDWFDWCDAYLRPRVRSRQAI